MEPFWVQFRNLLNEFTEFYKRSRLEKARHFVKDVSFWICTSFWKRYVILKTHVILGKARHFEKGTSYWRSHVICTEMHVIGALALVARYLVGGYSKMTSPQNRIFFTPSPFVIIWLTPSLPLSPGKYWQTFFDKCPDKK